MKTIDLLKKTSYKQIFNQIQKKFYPRDEYSNLEILNKDVFFMRLHVSLCDLSERIVPQHSLLITQFHDQKEELDICVLDEKEDALMPLDFFTCEELVWMNFNKSINIDNPDWIAHFIHEIVRLKINLCL